MERLAAEVKRRNSRTIVHVDAVQAWMRVPIKLANIDTLAVSGHKIHAPKGIGALYLSDSLYQAFQAPYLGGEQEREKRPGTENLPYALGLAAAATRLNKTMKSRDAAVRALNLRLREGLKAFPEVVINSPENAVPEVLNFSEMCIKSETMLAFLAEEQIYVSSASACGSPSCSPSAGVRTFVEPSGARRTRTPVVAAQAPVAHGIPVDLVAIRREIGKDVRSASETGGRHGDHYWNYDDGLIYAEVILRPH